MRLVGLSRTKRAALTSSTNVVAQAVQVVTGLYSVPVSLAYLGQERFGLWMALSALLMFISFSDFGVGIGAQDKVSKDFAAKDLEAACETYWSAFLFSVLLAFSIYFLGVFFLNKVSLEAYFSLKSSAARADLIPASNMVLLVLALGIVSGIVQRAYSALQQGYTMALMQILGRLLGLASLVLVVKFDLGFPALVFAVAGVPSAVILIVGLPTLVVTNPWIKPGFSSFKFDSALKVLSVGLMGLGASVSIYLVNNAGAALISLRYGADSLADYSVFQRLVNIPMMFVVYLLIPLWPAITEAKVSGDSQWIVRVFHKSSLMIVGFGVLCAFLLLLFGEWAIVLWTNNESVVPSFSLRLALVCFMLLSFWNTLVTTVLNGYSSYRSQATVGAAVPLVFVIIGFVLPVSYFSKDVMVWIVVLGYAIRCCVLHAEAMRLIYVEQDVRA